MSDWSDAYIRGAYIDSFVKGYDESFVEKIENVWKLISKYNRETGFEAIRTQIEEIGEILACMELVRMGKVTAEEASNMTRLPASVFPEKEETESDASGK